MRSQDRRTSLSVSCLGLLALLAGCGDDDSTGDDDNMQTTDAGHDASMNVPPDTGAVDTGASMMDSGPVPTDTGPSDLDAGLVDSDSGPVEEDAGPLEPIEELALLNTYMMPVDTHRPEILATPDNNLAVVVVEPTTDGDITYKHKAHIFGTDLVEIGSGFYVDQVTDEFGEPSDHRAVLAAGELVVVYQTNVWMGGSLPENPMGPMETYSEEQSLMMARFDFNGTMSFSGAIVSHVTDFNEDDFPDLCVTVLPDNTLLISTGTFDGAMLKIRHVDLNATVLDTHEITVSDTTVGDSVGNSIALQMGSTSAYTMFSATMPSLTASITATNLAGDFSTSTAQTLTTTGVEANFPVSNLLYEDHYYIAHLGRDPSGSGDIQTYPYSPYLLVIDSLGRTALSQNVGDPGFLHVHPTLARIGESLFMAYSKRTGMSPQVEIREYQLPTP